MHKKEDLQSPNSRSSSNGGRPTTTQFLDFWISEIKILQKPNKFLRNSNISTLALSTNPLSSSTFSLFSSEKGPLKLLPARKRSHRESREGKTRREGILQSSNNNKQREIYCYCWNCWSSHPNLEQISLWTLDIILDFRRVRQNNWEQWDRTMKNGMKIQTCIVAVGDL